MASKQLLRLENLTRRFPGGIFGIRDINLDIAAGEFLSLLGPSGCGKTTSLRVMAGFENPTGGRVWLDGQDITGLRPYDRPVNTVFQDYALFPHMNVAENVGFGLSLRKIAGSEQARRVARALDMVGLSDKIGVRVQALSGGQRQRVALARALVCEPRVLLLDEPLSALDAHLREQMQVELKRLQSELGTTFVMVTHDQTEALSISDRIAVMNHGRIEQVASPAELYDRPATRFVASFIGTMNLLSARFQGQIDSKFILDVDGFRIESVEPMLQNLRPGTTATVAIRPEDIEIGSTASGSSIPATINSLVFHGRSIRAHLALLGGQQAIVDIPRNTAESAVRLGDKVHAALRQGVTCTVLPD